MSKIGNLKLLRTIIKIVVFIYPFWSFFEELQAKSTFPKWQDSMYRVTRLDLEPPAPKPLLNLDIPNRTPLDFSPPPLIKQELSHWRQILSQLSPRLDFLPNQAKIEYENREEHPIIPISPTQYKLLQVEFALSKNQKELAFGLLLEVLSEKKLTNSDKKEALLKIIPLALEFNLYHDFVVWAKNLYHLGEKKVAFDYLITHFKSYDSELLYWLMKEGKVNQFFPHSMSPVFLNALISELIAKNQFQEIESFLNKIPRSYLATSNQLALNYAVYLYRTGKLTEAITWIEQLKSSELYPVENDLLKNERDLLLARFYFQRGDYQKAIELYDTLEPSFIDWPTAQIEKAWALVLNQDYESAAGNMYSLHIDYFKDQLIPESYLTRTLAYLGLCQYGDAFRVSEDFKTRFQELSERLETVFKNWQPIDYYTSIQTLANHSNLKEIQGVPKVWLIQLTRSPQFLWAQKVINQLEDEKEAYNRYTMKILKKEKEILEQKQKLITNKDAKIEDHEIVNLKLHIYRKSREALKNMRSQSLAKIDQYKKIFKNMAAISLKERMTELYSGVLQALEKLDVVQFEIYHQASEEIDKIARLENLNISHLKNENRKSSEKTVTWKYKGELWKDEIGKFKSSLKSACLK